MSVYRIAFNTYRTVRILGVEDAGPTVKTFAFKDKACAKAKPGQFLMLWIPGVDEIPLSIMDVDADGRVYVAVKKVGEATKALHNKMLGEILGVRGPFGNSFTIKSGKILMVGGGTGVAPLLLLAKKLRAKAEELTFVLGSRTRDELLFLDRLREICGEKNVIATTEDGSFGFKGLATAPIEGLLSKEKFEFVYACGPEPMIRQVFELAEKHGVQLEASLERIMRCAIGLCGSCVIGGYRVCRDGPIFTSAQLRKVVREFGAFKRDFSGRKVPLE
ncbi:MAG: dihydroorotate dehydrogenase electron transfer subunit [Candidatus Bathyarchaeia archaeon]